MAEDGGERRTDDESTTDAHHGDENTYRGLFGAISYAFRGSQTRLFKSYVVVGVGLTVFTGLLFVFALVGVFAATTGGRGGTFTFSRSFIVFVAILLVGPLLAPVLSLARNRRTDGVSRRTEIELAVAGYLFVVSLVMALFVSVPAQLQNRPSTLLVRELLVFYWLPRSVALGLILLSTLVVLFVSINR